MFTMLLEWLIQPLSIFILSVCAVFTISIVANWSARVQGIALGAIVGVLLVFSSPFFANYLVHSLEHARENPCWCDKTASGLPVVILGGGKRDYVESGSVYDILAAASIRRVAGAAKIADPDAQFYLMGGGRGKFKESRLMAEVLLDMGVDDSRIVREDRSQSTAGNARQLATLLKSHSARDSTEATEGSEVASAAPRIALVTSSLHVPRASRTFEAHGFEVCHYATDIRYAPAVLPVGLLPYVGALSKTTAALHEYMGYFYYWFKRDV